MRTVLALAALVGCLLSVTCKAEDLLVVADEFQAMQILIAQIRAQTKLTSRIVGQTELPTSLSDYRAVLVYIHGDLLAASEHALIDYTTSGGKLILLHHSISSHRRENKEWFHFLKNKLPLGDLLSGGYKHFAPVSFDVVNLMPGNYVASHHVRYDESVPYTDPIPWTGESPATEHTLPGTRFDDTEAYLNHNLIGARTLLLGLKYRDLVTGKVYMQNTAGWFMDAGKDWSSTSWPVIVRKISRIRLTRRL